MRLMPVSGREAGKGLALAGAAMGAGLLLWALLYSLALAAFPPVGERAAAPVDLSAPGTEWGGPLTEDTVLRAVDNPHVVVQTLQVPVGITLTVEPGAELYFVAGTSLIVKGRLLAQGTPTQTILFTRRDAGSYWGAIAILDSRVDNRITHAVIEYTREGVVNPRSHGVSLYNAQLTLADSVLRYTQNSAGVVANWDSTLHLLRNEIHDVQGDAVHPTGGVAVIQGNHIYNARGGAYYYEGIEISQMGPDAPAQVLDNHIHDVSDDCLDVNDSWVIIRGNRLHDCADKGISLGSAGNVGGELRAPTATLVNNLVYASQIGVAVKDRVFARMVHNTVADNGVGLDLYEDHAGYGGGRATVVNSIVWGSGPAIRLDGASVITVTFSDVEGGWPGEGNLDRQPSFAAVQDYHLGPGSPAIDAGDPAAAVGIAFDLDGRPRRVGSAPDMGAYEVQALLALSARPGDGRIRLDWDLTVEDPALVSFAISYTAAVQGSAVLTPVLITGLPTVTRAFTLSDLINYAWYTVVVEARDGEEQVLVRSNVVRVMPTDRYVYLPLLLAPR
jgi:hypothetical protein